MKHKGSCHCGNVNIEVKGECQSVVECNCSHCSRKGYLLWFVPRADVSVTAEDGALSTYTFNKHEIKHHFCATCGCAPFGFGAHGGVEMAAINVRCLEGIDLAGIKRQQVDGRSS
ncbi:GFA family protein [Alloalcanivorax mobilis]|uniref:GFA family protein n=1 Tax=Alloalcanivorax mobilis TaxID=2019569 RepID=UPI000B5B3183|nr:GFA family protein [Alloalcanivorax mobilis]ASK36082.1 aldehyde-activating protein [Alcanivorax sp. N3-2A]|tara:strand:- start:2768 stop:3112 length:345 start_codon:yes stop_codon:yes gene_type:complete